METSNKVWFVTGASKGFGLALVKLLLNSGYKVAATSRNAEELQMQVGQKSENFLAMKVNIADDQEVKEAMKQTVETFGRLDVVVNNAGYVIYGTLEELSEKEFRQSIEINLLGTVNTIRNAMPYLRKQKSGHIINFSSIGGYRGYASGAAYSSVKFAIIGLSESLAEEVKHLGVKVTVVAPGFFRTSFLDKGADMYAKNRIAEYNTADVEAWMQQMAGKQQGDPQKAVRLLIDITLEKNPPLHLILGPDAYQIKIEKATADEEEVEKWKALTFSTNFDN
jgi:NAD(P)-dependent dehydrogenase (short-subunit alcohol dehydrogenase family)